ncbi:MAG: DUF2141 domain-containing protein [Bacteroidales bacterium]|nr:DUF2141 domain-containing protein [Bacteroidales bacterium]
MRTLVFIFYFIRFSLVATTQNYNLTINISNIQDIRGEIRIGIYNSSADFPKEGKAYRNVVAKVVSSTTSIEINDLAPNDYGIALFHDDNSDKECNRNIMGIPLEGYGFSNNIKPIFSAPNFNECKFSLKQNVSITIKLIH